MIKQEKISLHKAFEQFDQDRDGLISFQEMSHSLSLMKFKLKKSEAQQIMETLDLDRDGHLNFEEFLAGMGVSRNEALKIQKSLDSSSSPLKSVKT